MSRRLPIALICLVSCGGIEPDLDGRDPYARYLAVRQLTERPDSASMGRLVAALEDPHFLVVVGALEGFAELGRPEFLQHAAPRLDHADPMVRRQACATLAAIRNPDGFPYLAKALKDPEPSVRRGAIEALRAFGSGPEVLRPLVEAMGDREGGVRLAAHEALQGLTGRTEVARNREAWEAALK